MRYRWNGPRCGWHVRRIARFAAGTEPGNSLLAMRPALTGASVAATTLLLRLSHLCPTPARKSIATTAGAAAAYAEFSAARH
ncbi:hypothetical protein CBM2589_B30068 [Cupriavidus taiwanensis]|uniref:Uncharacterized protein n=1 Tax=Cupriavidus taiwanensis TaxID=164546 RepID=A0A375BUJ0_9BURK|nr:hypothetical protein CBM2589_B30068 [Cupriavidus taiwanensis]